MKRLAPSKASARRWAKAARTAADVRRNLHKPVRRKCAVPSCRALPRDLVQTPEEFKHGFGRLCTRCFPAFLARLAMQPDTSAGKTWLDAIEERELWYRLRPPGEARARTL